MCVLILIKQSHDHHKKSKFAKKTFSPPNFSANGIYTWLESKAAYNILLCPFEY